MQIGTKFSIAIHILLSVEVFKEDRKVTSDFIAASAHTHPVIIRKIMSLLREAGLIEIAAGTGGIKLTKDAEAISLRDIYLAIDPVKDGRLFKIHTETAPACPVGGNIGELLGAYFADAQEAMEARLDESSLADLLADLDTLRAGKKRRLEPSPSP